MIIFIHFHFLLDGSSFIIQFSDHILDQCSSSSVSSAVSSDRYCALSKGVMRCYIAKGNNIDTHEKMFIALTKGKQLRGVSVHLGTVTHKDLPKTKIPGISNLGHFEFDGKDTISAWKFSGIGEGMKVSGLEGIDSSVIWHEHGGKVSRDGLMEEDKHKIALGEEPYFWFFPKKNKSPEPGDVDDEAATGEPIAIDPTIPSSPLFVCSQCSAEFIRHGSLLRHIESGRHKIRPEKITQFDFALGLYKRLLEEKLRAEETEKKMKDTAEIQPAERMMHDQIKNCIRGLLAAKKKEKTRGGNRRSRALVEDMITELDDEGGAIEEEVEVDEDDREITADGIYDMIHTNMAEFFDDPDNIVHSTPDDE